MCAKNHHKCSQLQPQSMVADYSRVDRITDANACVEQLNFNLPVLNGHIQHNRQVRRQFLPMILDCSHRRLVPISFAHKFSHYSLTRCILFDYQYANLCIQCLIHQIWIGPLFRNWKFWTKCKTKTQKITNNSVNRNILFVDCRHSQSEH